MPIDLLEIRDQTNLTLLEVINRDVVEVVQDPKPKAIEILGVGLPGAKGDTPKVVKGLTFIEPNATENISIFYTDSDITLTAINAMVMGDPGCSVTFSLLFGPDRNSGTEIVTGGTTVLEDPSGVVIDVLDEPAIPADNWVWLAITATSGFVTEFHVSVTH